MTGVILALAAWILLSGIPAARGASQEPEDFRAYEVNKKVSDFPDAEDLSTPEAAYASVNRLSAGGERGARWRALLAEQLRSTMPSEDKPTREAVPADLARSLLQARILEVRIFQERHSMIIAEVPAIGGYGGYVDGRRMLLEDGRWLNGGSTPYANADEARKDFALYCGGLLRRAGKGERKTPRPRLEDPEAHLRPFVDFLKAHGEEPRDFVMKALADHKVVIMGETHHRPRYWAFNASLVREPEFPKLVGTICMELPSNDQDLVDRFLAGGRPNVDLVIDMLRDMLWMGWPDQPMLDFFLTVWTVNQDLPAGQQIRIVLADMERPWEKIRKRDDWSRYNVNRDVYMADMIVRDLERHPEETRGVLFIVGIGHTMLELDRPSRSYPPMPNPIKSAGWHLQDRLGRENVFAIFSHAPSQTNMGQVHGRLCLGLFDSAFAAIENRPIAFPLDHGPFGEQPFDAMPDKRVSSSSKYKDGYDAYLYLGPLEHEIFSPLIAGFYTDEFVQELQRRTRIMHGKPWSETYGRKADAAGFIAWMRNSWGMPRTKWRNGMGPLNAWHYGDKWKEETAKQHEPYAFDHPEVIVEEAKKLVDAIRSADYESPGDWRDFPGKPYRVQTNAPGWMKWVCENFKRSSIQSVEFGKVLKGDGTTPYTITFKDGTVREGSFNKVRSGLPTVPYELTLKDGTVLAGILPFYYDAQSGDWTGDRGLDWHLLKPPLKLAEPRNRTKE